MSLIEENARIIAGIEPEWSDLGPLRQICFATRFNDYSDRELGAVPVDQQVAGFVVFANGEGCECAVAENQFGEVAVLVSKMMAPTAENITSLQEKLTSYTDKFQCAYVDGWHYPPKKTVVFWPGAPIDEGLAKARAEILFDGKLVNDPLQSRQTHQEYEFGRVARDPTDALRSTRISSGKRGAGAARNFTLVPSAFLLRAASMPPQKPEPTVSGFAKWIYSLYSDTLGTIEDREEGKEAETEIWRRRRQALNCTNGRFLRQWHPSWRLVHNGLHFGKRNNEDFFELTHLPVDGKPLRASPDLMYRNDENSEVVIVEIKFTRMAIPKNLWPNVWAQLWCYSQIEAIAIARNITVVGEIWGEMYSRGYGRGRNRVDGSRLICLRSSVKRDPRAERFDRFFRQLFEIYSGA